MNNKGLSRLRLRKVKELLKVHFRFSRLRREKIIYGRNLFEYLFQTRTMSLSEFCYSLMPDCNMESAIDSAYSKFILTEYDIKEKGADFKFNTIRNVFKYAFRTRAYMMNHYADKLSLPVIKLLKTEFASKDLLNITIPRKVNVMAVLRKFEHSAYDYIMRECDLIRAGPHNVELRIVA